MTRPVLIVFARAPAIGVGKSRLARDVGRVEAWRLYRAMSAQLLRRLKDPRWRLVVRLAPDRARIDGFASEPQGRGDLGTRLARALKRHARGPVAVIGTDAPDVTPSRVAGAFRGARGPGAAIGPAEDGGFWILALSPARARRIGFEGVRWSGPHTFEDTLRVLGGKAEVLETLVDVDDGAALRAWRARSRR
jgi:hypothetical protein